MRIEKIAVCEETAYVFWKRKKEEKPEEVQQETELREEAQPLKMGKADTGEFGQDVVERLEQMLELTKEIEDGKAEYRMVTSYLSDIELLAKLPEDERKRLEEIAVNVVQLNAARTEFLNSAKKLSDAQFEQMEKLEQEIPGAIKRFSANELYRDTLRKDLKYLDREKSEWELRKEYLKNHITRLRYLLYVTVGVSVTAAVILGILQIVLEADLFYGWMAWIFATAVIVCVIYLRMQGSADETVRAQRSLNRAISLENKVKIKYVNMENAVDYAKEKYHVRSAGEFKEQWEYYLEAVKEREKYQRTNEDLDYFKGRLVRMLSQYKLYDAQVWVTQAAALVDKKEMVEVKHGLVNRRQKLRARIEYNLSVIRQQKAETERLLKDAKEMRPQAEQILDAIDRLSEIS